MRLNACLRIVTADRLACKASTDLSMFGQMSVDSKISQSSSEPIHGESSNQQIEMTSRTPCDAVDCAEGRGVEGRGVEGRGVEGRGVEVGYESTRKSPEMEFVPVEPKDLFESGLSEAEIESLILKFLHFYGCSLGRHLSEQIKLPFGIVKSILDGLKNQLLVAYRNFVGVNDYEYELTNDGRDKAKRLTELCSYCGAAPVGFNKYVESVERQSLQSTRIGLPQIQQALKGLHLPTGILEQLGQAVNSGRCILLHGESGNGKTSVATRCVDAYEDGIWIPRTLAVCGEIVRFYDPTVHQTLPTQPADSLLRKSIVDQRWVRIKRPGIIVGGELNLEHLEISQNRHSGILEAPIHMKSNNGCLVVDDLGRQRLSISELFNRWIIPMENGHDYICLPNGRKIQSPFDQLLIFSTNMKEKCLSDEAFFRRIPYKIQLSGPSDSQFIEIFIDLAQMAGFVEPEGICDYLISKIMEFRQSLKFCYASDIIKQCSEFCDFHSQDRILDKNMIDKVILNYFGDL